MNKNCNICGRYELLTYDHVPPAGCLEVKHANVRSIIDRLTSVSENEERSRKYKNYQRGFGFETLCADCNNRILGNLYDPHLINFVKIIRNHVTSGHNIPFEISIDCCPQKIIRSVLGHLSAVGENSKTDKQEIIRRYILDPNKNLTSAISVYYWFYPFRANVILKNFVLHEIDTKVNVLGWLLKFFPVAFYVVFDAPKEFVMAEHSFNDFRNLHIDKVTSIPFRFSTFTTNLWPESPTQNSFTMMGSDGYSSLDASN